MVIARLAGLSGVLALLGGAQAAPGEGAWPATGAIVARFDAEPDPAALDRLGRWERAVGRWPIVRIWPSGDPAVALRRLEERFGLRWADWDRIAPIQSAGLPYDDPLLPAQWHLENTGQDEVLGLPGADVGAFRAWAAVDGAGLLIAVLDGGVDLGHPDLDVSPEGFDIFDNDADASPDPASGEANHGTAVAGLAAAIGGNGVGVVGVAPAAAVLPIRAVGEGATLFGIYNAFAFATDAGADVLNNSWGFGDEACGEIPDYPLLRDAVEYPRIEGRGGRGAVVVFAAGNSGCDGSGFAMHGAPGVIVVGAVGDRDRRADYSNTGDHLDLMAPSGGGSAGGWTLTTTDHRGEVGWNDLGGEGEYTGWMSGTSGAAPIAAGAAALVIAANPRLSEAEVRAVLCATAERVAPDEAGYDGSGWSRTYGCGRVDVGAAVGVAFDRQAAAAVWRDRPAAIAPGAGAFWDQAPDPDGDALRWEIDLATEDGTVETIPVDQPAWAPGLPAGTRGSATIATLDAWGRVAVSEPWTFEVVAPAVPPDGDGCRGGAGVLPLLFVLRPRRCSRRSSR